MLARRWFWSWRFGPCLGLALLVSSGCSSRQAPLAAPLGAVGTYSLASCGVWSSAIPIPCTVAVSPDSVRALGAALTLKADMTWTSQWHEAMWSNGSWGRDTVYALSGGYAPVQGTSTLYTMWSPSSPVPPELVVTIVVAGQRLDYDTSWTFQRQEGGPSN